jgi:hypothetical protein
MDVFRELTLRDDEARLLSVIYVLGGVLTIRIIVNIVSTFRWEHHARPARLRLAHPSR